MNENQAKLVAALRSREFSQAKGYLRTDRGHCCLGVACEVYRRETGDGEWATDSGIAAVYAFRVNGVTDIYGLPGPVTTWLDMATNGEARPETVIPERILGHYTEANDPDETVTLARLNDAGATFAEIADLIEAGAVFGATE